MTRSSSSPEEEQFIHPLGWKTDDREDEETLKLVVLCTEKKETMDKHTVHKTCTKWAPPWTLFPGGSGSYGPGKQLKQPNIQSTKPDTASSEPHPGPRTRSLGKGGVTQTRKATKVDQVSPTLDPVTHSQGEGGVTDQESKQRGSSEPHPGPSDPLQGGGGRYTDQESKQSGSSEPHPGPSDPFTGGGRSYRAEKQPKWIKSTPPWTQWPIPWGRGELQTRKATKVDQVSPTLDPVTRSLGEGGDTDQKSNQNGSSEPHPGRNDPWTGGGGVTDQKTNQSGSSEPHPGPSDPWTGGGGSYRREKQPKWIKWAPPWTQWPMNWGRGSYRPEKQPKRIRWAPPWTQWPVPWGREETQTRKATKEDQVSPTLDPVTCSLREESNNQGKQPKTPLLPPFYPPHLTFIPP